MVEPTDFNLSYLRTVIHGYTLNENFYNCSNPDGIEGKNVRRTVLGTYFMVSGVVFMALYIPCIIVCLRSEWMKTSCYKIMICLSIFDLISLVVNSLATGFFGFIGANFCDFPKTMYTLGAVGVGSWMAGCYSCVLLAMNRCCNLHQYTKMRWIFTGYRVQFLLFSIFIYWFYNVFLTVPAVFHCEYMSWFFNPRISTNPMFYINIQHSINNIAVSICTTSIYSYLCILLVHKTKYTTGTAISRTQRQVFLQSVLICSFNAIAAYIYVYMQYFLPSVYVILLGQLAWQFSNGSVGIVYLTMNRTIRNGVLEMFCSSRKSSEVNTIARSTNNNNNSSII